MSRRISRAESFDELISLLESGVRDLAATLWRSSTVTASSRNGRILARPIEGAPRSEGEKNFSGMRFHVRWVFPTHESESYQKYLMLTWYRVVERAGSPFERVAEGSRLYEWMAEQRYALPNKYIIHTRLLAMATDEVKAGLLERSSLPFYVVTVNYNDYADLKKLIASLLPLKYLKRLIVVNHSDPRRLGRSRPHFHNDSSSGKSGLRGGFEQRIAGDRGV